MDQREAQRNGTVTISTWMPVEKNPGDLGTRNIVLSVSQAAWLLTFR